MSKRYGFLIVVVPCVGHLYQGVRKQDKIITRIGNQVRNEDFFKSFDMGSWVVIYGFREFGEVMRDGDLLESIEYYNGAMGTTLGNIMGRYMSLIFITQASNFSFFFFWLIFIIKYSPKW